MIKKITTTVFSAFAYIVLFSQQENTFVEVSVDDTLHATPDEIIFIVEIKGDAQVSFGTGKLIHSQNKIAKQDRGEEKIRAVIAMQKIDTLSQADYVRFNEEYNDFIKEKFFLRFASPLQLFAFIKATNNIDNVSGHIVSKKCSRLSYYKEILTKKLLEKALKESTFIAEQSNKKPGKLLQVKDDDVNTKEVSSGQWTSFPPLSAFRGLDNTSYETNIIVERRIRVRYSWE